MWDGKVKRKENEEREPPQLDAGVGESVSVGNWLITDDRGCNDPLEGFFPLPYTHTHGMFVMEDRGIEEEEEAQPTPSHLLLRRYTHEHRERKKMAVSLSLYIQRNIERSKNTTTPSVKIRFFFSGILQKRDRMPGRPGSALMIDCARREAESWPGFSSAGIGRLRPLPLTNGWVEPALRESAAHMRALHTFDMQNIKE